MQTSDTQPPSRREARRQSRHDAILEVAGPWFLEHGYDGTTMSAIAAALGGSKGTLWNHFPSKELLFSAVLERTTTEFRTQLSLTLNPSDDFEQALHKFCHTLLTKVTAPEAIALHRLIVGEVNRFPEIGSMFYERGPRLTQKMLADFLSGAMDRGLLRKDDPLGAAYSLTGICLYGCHQQMLLGVIDTAPPETITRDARRAVDVFLRAYAPPR
jgi:AcrR family transcriptional regulator